MFGWGGSFKGVFKQTGGTNATGTIHLDAGGEYDLIDGDFSAGAYFTGGLLRQQGGQIHSGLGIWRGSYLLGQGVIYGGVVVPAFDGFSVSSGGATVVQGGGTNFGSLLIGEFGSGLYTMSNGVSLAPAITVYARGSVQQWGGVQNVAGMVKTITDYIARDEFGFGAYTLNGGTLTCGGIEAGGHFIQSGGTNTVSGSITLNGVYGDFEMYGGELSCDSAAANPSWVGGFSVAGGRLVVTNQLSVGGNGLPDWLGLVLLGGELVVSNITLTPGALFSKSGGVLVQSGLLTLMNANVYVGTGAHEFGALNLEAKSSSQTNSILYLPGSSPCTVNFSNSSAVLWSNAATLTIENWAGSWAGGGSQQVIFGANGNALTATQVTQVLFDNPAGFTPGLYTARILANGELVPNGVPPTGFYSPMLSLIRQRDGTMELTVRGEPGANYGIDTSTNLANWTTWTNVFSDSTGIASAIDSGATNHGYRFYRAILLP